MKWQSIAPVDGAGASCGVIKYSAEQQGYADDRRRRWHTYQSNPREEEDGATDKFLSSGQEKTSEFQLLLNKLMEDNEKMVKAAGKLSPGIQTGRMFAGAQAFGLSGGYILSAK